MLISFFSSFSQVSSIQLEYKFTIKTDDGGESVYFSKLKDNGKESIYSTKDTLVDSNSGRVVKMKNGSQSIYVDKSKNILLMYAPIFSKDYYIKEDSLNTLFKWKMVDSVKKTILNYECMMATCTFRGRDYQAFYTDKLPFFTGPWKLSGLPGVILEAKTTDDRFTFVAYKLSLSTKNIEIKNPFEGIKIGFLPFVEHKKLLLSKLQAAQEKAQSQEKDEDISYTFKDKSIELLK